MAFAGAPRISDFERAAEKVLRTHPTGEFGALSRALTAVAQEEVRAYTAANVAVTVELHPGKVPARLPGFFAEARGEFRRVGNQYEIHAAVPTGCFLLGRVYDGLRGCRAMVLSNLVHEFTHLKQGLAGSRFRPARVRRNEREPVSYYASAHETQAHAAIASAPELFGDDAEDVVSDYEKAFATGTGRDKKHLFKFKRQMGRFAQQRQDDQVYAVSDLIDGHEPDDYSPWLRGEPSPTVLRRAEKLVNRDLYEKLRREVKQKGRK
jgi:hypothetical protein